MARPLGDNAIPRIALTSAPFGQEGRVSVRCGGKRRVVSSIATLLVAGAASPILANDAPALSSVVFAGAEIESRSSFVSSGGKLLYPVGPDTKIFVLGAAGFSLSDLRRLRAGKPNQSSVAADARLFIGAERSFGALFISFGAGPSLNAFQTKSGLAQHRAGAALHADVWFRPTDNDVVNAVTIADTGPRSVWFRLRYGRKILPPYPVVVGPEVAVNRSITTAKYRAGMHISDLAVGKLALSLAGGWLWDHRRSGQYLTLSAYMRY